MGQVRVLSFFNELFACSLALTLLGLHVGCLLPASTAVKGSHSFPRPPPFSNRHLFLNLN